MTNQAKEEKLFSLFTTYRAGMDAKEEAKRLGMNFENIVRKEKTKKTEMTVENDVSKVAKNTREYKEDKDSELIVALGRLGLSKTVIANLLHVCRHKVIFFQKKAGILKNECRTWDDKKKSLLVKLVIEEKKSLREAASVLGVTVPAINSMLTKLNAHIRPKKVWTSGDIFKALRGEHVEGRTKVACYKMQAKIRSIVKSWFMRKLCETK